MKSTILLLGNPNSGKTTLFNTLTCSHNKVGNWTGVTVTEREGEYRKNKDIVIVDLPGLYSLDTDCLDEKVVIDRLNKKDYKAVINIIDGTNIERNLLLTMKLCKLNIPMVIAVNMIDELEKNNVKLNIVQMEKIFGVKVVPISALKDKNIDKLIETATFNAKIPINKQEYEKGDFNYIEKIMPSILQKKVLKIEKITQKLDKFLMHPVLGFDIFFIVMTLVYFLSNFCGGLFSEYITVFFNRGGENLYNFLMSLGVFTWLCDLLYNGIIKGLGTVFSFFPQILILFTLLSLIDGVGYASRIAFIFDRLFSSVNLNGKSIMPLVVSCGCTVSGIMATRTIENDKERKLTIILTQFMPCGAKAGIYGWFSYKFFNGNPFIATSLYFLGFICVFVFGGILKKLGIYKSEKSTFLLEIPPLRVPSIKNVVVVIIEKLKDFTIKAGTIIVAISSAIWLLQNFGFNGYTYGEVEKSFIFILGNKLCFVFVPLGFGNWEATVGILSGIFSKESVVQSLEFITSDINGIFGNKFSAYAYLTFILLSPPCVASLSVAYNELKSLKWFCFMLVFELISAYLVSLIINVVGLIYYLSFGLLLSLILVIIILHIIFISFKSIAYGCDKKCYNCKKDGVKCQKISKHNTTI